MGKAIRVFDGSGGPDDVRRRTLVAAASRGDREALAKVAELYWPLVRSIARRHSAPAGGEEIEDLIQAGMVGLLEAVDRYDPETGGFERYAYATVSGAIKRHLRDRSWRVSLPRSLHDAWIAVERERPRLSASLGREPTAEELASATGLDAERVVEALVLRTSSRLVSLDERVSDDSSEPIGAFIAADEDPIARAERRVLVGQLTKVVRPRERAALALRYAGDLTQGEVARRIGVSQMHVSRMLRGAIERIRAAGPG